jgi:RNA polymerase sigma-70 factor, ECF subfamily
MKLLDVPSCLPAPHFAEVAIPKPCTPPADQVFAEHATRVYNLARRMLGNHSDAEDVTQDVFLQVVRHLDNFRGECGVTTWLHRITVNAALALRRRRYRQQERQADAPLEQLPSGQPGRSECPEGQAMNRETRLLLERSIAQLPDIYRDVFLLSDVEGLTNPEIGSLLGLGLAAVKSRLHRARLLVRDMLSPHFHGVSDRQDS